MCHSYDSKWDVSNNYFSIDSAWTNYKNKKTVLKSTVVSFQGQLYREKCLTFLVVFSHSKFVQI